MQFVAQANTRISASRDQGSISVVHPQPGDAYRERLTHEILTALNGMARVFRATLENDVVVVDHDGRLQASTLLKVVRVAGRRAKVLVTSQVD